MTPARFLSQGLISSLLKKVEFYLHHQNKAVLHQQLLDIYRCGGSSSGWTNLLSYFAAPASYHKVCRQQYLRKMDLHQNMPIRESALRVSLSLTLMPCYQCSHFAEREKTEIKTKLTTVTTLDRHSKKNLKGRTVDQRCRHFVAQFLRTHAPEASGTQRCELRADTACRMQRRSIYWHYCTSSEYCTMVRRGVRVHICCGLQVYDTR